MEYHSTRPPQFPRPGPVILTIARGVGTPDTPSRASRRIADVLRGLEGLSDACQITATRE